MIRLTRGFDVKLKGAASSDLLAVGPVRQFAVKPGDLPGVEAIPKLLVEPGAKVRSGDAIFSPKARPGVRVCAPVAGSVVEVRRGPKRAIAAIVIEADQPAFKKFSVPTLTDRAALVELLLESGAWVLMRQRPFNVIPDPAAIPRDIFISCFDTAPLAPDYRISMQGREAAFEVGLKVLAALTAGAVHLGVNESSSELFRGAGGVEVHEFSGPHPAGAVGVQIHHIAPINKGEVVWTVKPQDVATIGTLVTEGIFDPRRTVALTGAEVRTGYVETWLGAAIAPLIDGHLSELPVRLISGNVLSGTRIQPDGFLGWFDEQFTVIEEGDQPEFLGWLYPSYPRPSLSRTFLSYLAPNRQYRANSNQHGEERAFVMTGEYERVLPMDLHPQHLLKAILCRDFEQTEGLGIYEVVEEDLALCEFVCTSKQPVQRILRDGLEWIHNEA
jgi:Na+-transporting NADH:ubiquinone oxidoreductase subunit A